MYVGVVASIQVLFHLPHPILQDHAHHPTTLPSLMIGRMVPIMLSPHTGRFLPMNIQISGGVVDEGSTFHLRIESR
jgi:hypothetical protein